MKIRPSVRKAQGYKSSRARSNAINVVSKALMLVVCFGSALTGRAQSGITGEWSVEVKSGGRPALMSLQVSTGNGDYRASFNIGPEALRGLTPQQILTTDSAVSFKLVRDAGTINCEGTFKPESGSGLFTFIPNPGFVVELGSRGHGNVSDFLLFQMAAQDVNLAYVQGLSALGFDKIPAVQLISFRLYGVTPQFIRELGEMGYNQVPAGQLYALRVHDVTPGFIKSLSAYGYTNLTIKQILALRRQGVDQAFVEELRSLGLNSPTANELVQMRIHNVSPTFIRTIRSLGYENITAGELIKLRIHRITPDFIQKASAKKAGNLPVDQLVKMWIASSDK